MRKLFSSFTTTFGNYMGGRLSWNDLTDPESHFMFNCARAHCLREDGSVPMELTWQNKTKPHLHDSSVRVVASDVDDYVLLCWASFRTFVLEPADKDGRIWYNKWDNGLYKTDYKEQREAMMKRFGIGRLASVVCIGGPLEHHTWPDHGPEGQVADGTPCQCGDQIFNNTRGPQDTVRKEA